MVTKRHVDGLDAKHLLRMYHSAFERIIKQNDAQIEIHIAPIPRHTWFPSVAVFESTVMHRNFLLSEEGVDSGKTSLIELIDLASDNLQFLASSLRSVELGCEGHIKRKAARAAYGEFLIDIITKSEILRGGGRDPNWGTKRDELEQRKSTLPRFCNDGVNGDCIRVIDAIEEAMESKGMRFKSFRKSNPERFGSVQDENGRV